ncbi:MAG: hypothetical protein E7117_05930 [Bacteroidales bacterium]|nr:hypothetical protein [Bacteroidales bacterium]
MKRLVALVVAVTVLVAVSFSFTSCEKITKPKHLAGTTWTGMSSYGASYNFNFTSESSVMYSASGPFNYTATGTFTFTNPSITITGMADGGMEIWTGTVNESIMTLTYQSESLTLTKIGK